MTNSISSIHPSELFKGDIVFYADGYAVEKNLSHLWQLTQVTAVTSTSVLLDNGRKFSLESGEEATRSSKGQLYPYTHMTIAMVNEAQAKLPLLNDVKDIEFSTLSAQQLRMILDVARGAFTQVSFPTPCGGCEDKVEVAGLSFETQTAIELAYGKEALDRVISNVAPPLASDYEVSATIGFSDATYELSDSELDDIDDADDDDIIDEDEE